MESRDRAANPPSGQVSPAPAPWAITDLVSVVNAPPVAQDQSVEVTRDTAKAITLTATDDASVASYTIAAAPTHGTVTLDDAGAGAVTYKPDTGYEGADSFTFNATDNEGKISASPGVVSVTVVAPLPPTCTSPIALTLTSGGSSTIDPVPCSGEGFTPSATSVAVVADPASGTATVGVTGAVTYTNTDTGAATITLHLHRDERRRAHQRSRSR